MSDTKADPKKKTKQNSNNYNKSSDKISCTSKDSFNGFDLDLTEVLLSYLTLKDKIRFECVSKKWQKLIPIRQKSLCINNFLYGYISDNTGEIIDFNFGEEFNAISIKLLRKFKNLRELEVNASNADEDISQIINVLLKTKSIKCLEKFKLKGIINKKVFIQFGRKCLKLKSLSIDCSDIFRDIRISNEFLINLKKSKKLKELKLDMKIIKTFDNLKVLVLHLDEEHIDSNDIKRVTDLKSLTKLYIYYTNLKPETHLSSNIKFKDFKHNLLQRRFTD